MSGTREDLKKKCVKLDNAIERIVKRHRETDLTKAENRVKETKEQYISTLKNQVKKMRDWLDDDNDDKPGRKGKPTQSNITDNVVFSDLLRDISNTTTLNIIPIYTHQYIT